MSANNGRLPDFLLIGAMKAGSTSLAHDLGAMPDVYMPSVKEPHFLCLDNVLTPGGTATYSQLFSRCRPGQICGEGSTGYTKLPDAKGVPRRARQLLGPDLRLIYIVRNPVDRALSHHYHEYRSGKLPADPERALAECPSLAHYGRYMWQLQAWLDEFAAENVHVVLFEDYISAREQELSRLRSFLGLPAIERGSLDAAQVSNRGEETRVMHSWLTPYKTRLTHSAFYKVWIHPYLPRGAVEAAKKLTMRDSPPRPPRPGRESLERLSAQFADDAEQLQKFLGRSRPLWQRGERIAECAAASADDGVEQPFAVDAG